MANLNQISVVFPNGNEKIFGRQMEISWQKPRMSSSERFSLMDIEIFFTDNYIDDHKTSWSRIARIPYVANNFIWNFGDRFKSEKCRIGLRVIDSDGRRTKIFKSAANFSISKSPPRTPSVISPAKGMRYSDSMPIILDFQGVVGTNNARDRIFVYYRSVKKEIPLTAIRERIPVGTGPIRWDISDLPNSDDYEVVVFSSDDYNSRSSEVVIKDISIFNEGYFIRDFFPPEGFMVINDGETYTKETRVNAKLYTYDESTDIHGVRFSELSSEYPYDEVSISPPQFYTESMSTSIEDVDGKGVLSAIVQDFGGNRSDPQDDGLFLPRYGIRNFRSLLNPNSNTQISDILSIPPSGGQSFGSIYFITTGDKLSLFEIKNDADISHREIAELPMECNLVTNFFDTIYISGISQDRTFNLLRYNGDMIEEAYLISDTESEISSMIQFNSSLYLGCLNGDIYKFDGTSLSLEGAIDGSPGLMRVIGSNMYILSGNANSLYVYNGESIRVLSIESNIIN
ncbi:hypothetical protein CMI47_11570 [Candidatus Pacearchaeota archaeon]|jgi:hypothetical protein|nr:hypothetical protein [Candidatus Pacearchaeota archaeon]|tara:strand:+ start:22168 stop:23706 length:1539 start_codon:yes stop_codon:yes gene_type:complete